MSGWVSPTHPAPSPIPPGCAGGVVMGREVGGENGHPHPHRVDGALSRCRSQGRGACAAGALCRTSVFEMGGACFKEPGPVIFASGGVGTDFTRRCAQDGRVQLFSTGALCWTGFGLLPNTVEEYVLLSVFLFCLHTFVGLKRTWDQKLSSGRSLISSSSVSRTLNNISCDIHPHSSNGGQVGLPTTNGEHCTGEFSLSCVRPNF